MNARFSIVRRMVIRSAVAVLIAAAIACQRAPVTAPDSELASAAAPGNAQEGTPSEVNAQLAALRALVAHYHDLDKAMAAGYIAEVTPCLARPGVGGMGFHYGNPAFINDPAVRVLEPELLLYEPEQNGQMRFVGVEYIIPFALLPSTAPPPVLFGHEMHHVPDAGIWALHAWVGGENPLGIFEDWNPKVSCEFAE